MYIEITVDLKNYHKEAFDLRLSNYHTIKQLISIVWQAKSIPVPPREGHWVRVANKNIVLSGVVKLVDGGVITGDRIEIM